MCCVALVFLVLCFILTAFALQAAFVWMNAPPIAFGQAAAMSLLNLVIGGSLNVLGYVVIAEIARPRKPPPEAELAMLAGTTVIQFLMAGWLYTKFFEAIRVGRGVAIALVAAVIQTLLLALAFFALFLLGIAIRG